MKWFKYESQNYMDPQPEIGFKMFEDLEKAQDWAKCMRTNWSGTCLILGFATKQEILEYIDKYNLTPDERTMANIYNDKYYVLEYKEIRKRLADALDVIIASACNIDAYTNVMGKSAFNAQIDQVETYWSKLDDEQDRLSIAIDSLQMLLMDLDKEDIEGIEQTKATISEMMNHN